MRARFINPGNMAHTTASHLPTPQQFSSEVPALQEATAAERGRTRTGEHP